MSIRRRLATGLNALLKPLGARIVSESEFDAARQARATGPSFNPLPLPPGAADYLQPDNPRLLELRERYDRFQSPVTVRSGWSAQMLDQHLFLQHFRGDTVYVWQFRDRNDEANYLLTAYHLREADRHGLFRTLKEDGLFGAYVFDFVDGIVLSRDLLDSIAEIYFLDDMVSLMSRDSIRMLDIGAGYGRLAHRLVDSVPGLEKVLCADVVPESTFLCEYYLRFRGVSEKAVAVPLDEIQQALSERPVQIATSVSSLVECPLAAVAWWLDLIRNNRVHFLMVVPSPSTDGTEPRLLTMEPDGSRIDFLPEIEKRGYRLIAKRPKFAPEFLQRLGVSPSLHFLFELRA